MKNRKIIVGLLLLIIGVFWFLSDLGYVAPTQLKLVISRIIEMWPLALIIIGTYMVTEKRRNRTLVVIIVVSIWLLYVLDQSSVLVNLHRMITGQ